MSSSQSTDFEIPALLISPHRGLAESFLASVPHTRAFQILDDMRSYPTRETMEIRARQLKPELVLIDVATDLAAAIDLIRHMSAMQPPLRAVGLDLRNDSQTIVQSLRAGAVEFLNLPFDPMAMREPIHRLRRLITPQRAADQIEQGRVVAFASSKPGSGASTLATQTAFALQRITRKRVLLADCDLTGGTIGFYLKLSHSYSLVDALQHVQHLDAALWSSLAVNYGGVDILPAPAVPYATPLDPARLRMLAEQARNIYDWVVLDLPTVFSRTSLMAITESERAFVVSTAELPSLHLTRKALNMVDKLGLPKERFQVVVNRVDRRDDIGRADMEKLFGCSVHAVLPNDYFALHRVVTLGQPLGPESELGRAIEGLAQQATSGQRGSRELTPA